MSYREHKGRRSETADTPHSHDTATLPSRIDAGDAQVCCLIRAILSETVLLPDLQERLQTMGTDLDALRRCLERYCAEHPAGPEAG